MVIHFLFLLIMISAAQLNLSDSREKKTDTLEVFKDHFTGSWGIVQCKTMVDQGSNMSDQLDMLLGHQVGLMILENIWLHQKTPYPKYVELKSCNIQKSIM